MVSTRIGLISDPHATAAPVAEALALFKAAGVDHIFCAGDIAGYGNELEQTLDLLIEGGCRAVIGNHDLWVDLVCGTAPHEVAGQGICPLLPHHQISASLEHTEEKSPRRTQRKLRKQRLKNRGF